MKLCILVRLETLNARVEVGLNIKSAAENKRENGYEFNRYLENRMGNVALVGVVVNLYIIGMRNSNLNIMEKGL